MTPQERIVELYEHLKGDLADWHARAVLANEFRIVGDQAMYECQAWMIENQKYPTNNIWWNAKDFGFFSARNNDVYSVTVNPEEVDTFPGGPRAQFVNGRVPEHAKIPDDIFKHISPKEDGRTISINPNLAVLERRLGIALAVFKTKSKK